MYSILAVSSFLFLNYLFIQILIALYSEPVLHELRVEVLYGFPTILFLSIVLPAYATYVLLKRYS